MAAGTQRTGAMHGIRNVVRAYVQTHRVVLAALVFAMMLGQSVWVYLDKQSPTWDPAHYLDLALGHERALRSGGVSAFFVSVVTSDPVRAPLLTMLTVPVFLLVGPGPDRGTIVNLLLWPVLLVAVFRLGRRFFSPNAGLLAAFFAATTPIIFGLAHEFYVEFLLTTLVTLSVLLFVETEGLMRRRTCVALGVVLGLGMLTKITFPLYIVGPMAILGVTALAPQPAAQEQRRLRRLHLTRLAINAVIVGVLAAAIPFFWYTRNLKPSLDYASWASNGAGSTPYGPANPADPYEIAKFTLLLIAVDLSWLYALVPVAAGLLWIVARRTHRLPSLPILKVLVLLAWVAIPFWYVALSHNHDPRFLAPAMPGVALLLACLLTHVPQPQGRRALILGTVALGAFQWFAALFTVPVLPDKVQIATPIGDAIFWWQGPQSRAHNHQPYGSWQVDEILTYLATENPSPRGVKPLTVGLLEEHPEFNGNTLGFYADARHLPFTFVQVGANPADPGSPLPRLQTCDYVLILQQSNIDPFSDNYSQEVLRAVNRTSAAAMGANGLVQQFIQTPIVFSTPDGQVVLYKRDDRVPDAMASHPASIVFGHAIEFVGYDLVPDGRTTEGQVYTVTYYWRTLRPPGTDYHVFVHIGEGERIVAGNDHNPPEAAGPTSRWVPGQMVRYSQQLFVPNTLAPGSYPINVGLFVPNVIVLPITSAPPDATVPGTMGGRVGSLVVP